MSQILKSVAEKSYYNARIGSPHLTLGAPKLSHVEGLPLPKRPQAPRGPGDPWGGSAVPVSPPPPQEAVEDVVEEALFLLVGTPSQFSLNPRALLAELTLLFMLIVFFVLNLETLQVAKRGVLSPDGVCEEVFFFPLKTSSLLLCYYRLARRAPVLRPADKMAPG